MPNRRRFAENGPTVSWALLLGALGLISVVGCSRSDGRIDVQGAVQVDGAPLEDGSINFSPLPGTSASSSGGPVQQGKFQLQGERGLLPGSYRVTVSGVRPTGRMVEDPQMGSIAELAPLKFQESPEAAVAASGDNAFHFELTTKP